MQGGSRCWGHLYLQLWGGRGTLWDRGLQPVSLCWLLGVSSIIPLPKPGVRGICTSAPLLLSPYHLLQYIHGLGWGKPQLEALDGAGTGHIVLEVPLSFPWGLFQTHCQLPVGLEPVDAAGSDSPMSPACRDFVHSSHFFLWPVTLENQSKKSTGTKKMNCTNTVFLWICELSWPWSFGPGEGWVGPGVLPADVLLGIGLRSWAESSRQLLSHDLTQQRVGGVKIIKKHELWTKLPLACCSGVPRYSWEVAPGLMQTLGAAGLSGALCIPVPRTCSWILSPV